MRVGFVIDRWQPSRGGAEAALMQLATHLEQRGHEVLAFSERGPQQGEAATGTVHLVQRGGWTLSRGKRERRFASSALLAAEEQRCDVTIAVRHVSRADLYWPHGGSHARSLAAVRAARAWSPERPAAITPVTPRGRHRAFLEFERELMAEGGARRVVCVSQLVEEELAADFPTARDRLVRIENGVDLARLAADRRAECKASVTSALGLKASHPLIAFVARDAVLKGLPVLLASLSQVKQQPWNLVAAGPRDASVWRRRARAVGLDAERVRIVESFDGAELLSAADVCAHPTWRDTSGLVLLESLASGTPVITTSRAGEASTIRAYSGTVLSEPGDAVGLAAALTHWLTVVGDRAVEHDAIRATVADRGTERWLERLEGEVLAAAR